MKDGWEMVIGLEVHTELRTTTKLFCHCRNAFGATPNTLICPVCLGLPGSLPVLNKFAVELAARIGAALNCTVQDSLFHRKNYFYPDMPKDYQISQYDLPINADGWLDLPAGKRIGIVRAHMEEDTGKTTHLGGAGRIHDASRSLVDYNRSGVPLVEIVSAPDLSTSDEARAYVEELRGILVAVDASDGKLEEGSVRVDANVSVRRSGDSKLGTRCEIKNLNSLRSLGRAIDYEADRQVELLLGGERVVQQTRHWNDADGRTQPMRSKEEAFDYRYFPEPDLVPIEPDPKWVAEVAAALPALPAARRAAVATATGAAPTNEPVATVVGLELDGLLLAAVDAGADGALALRRLANEVAATSSVPKLDDFVAVLGMESRGELTTAQAREVLKQMLESGEAPAAVTARLGYEALGEGELDQAIEAVIAGNPGEWARYQGGDERLTGFFIGKLKAATGGKADLKRASEELRRRAQATG
ncbi:MAG: Asp-tRNA(Asn)/Glu-tRNA(Gln) amidotransferase subunit GatB [Acidimicrobiales bacterium]